MVEISGKVVIDQLGNYWRCDVHDERMPYQELESTLEEILIHYIGSRVKITVEELR